MKKMLIFMLLNGFLVGSVLAEGKVSDQKKERTPQQQKMADCHKEAKTQELKGDARKKFMSECLSAKPAS